MGRGGLKRAVFVATSGASFYPRPVVLFRVLFFAVIPRSSYNYICLLDLSSWEYSILGTRQPNKHSGNYDEGLIC